jgi:hypothetical protein
MDIHFRNVNAFIQQLYFSSHVLLDGFVIPLFELQLQMRNLSETRNLNYAESSFILIANIELEDIPLLIWL